jgi:hypothetical protein
MLIKFSAEKSLTAVSAALHLTVAANHFVITQLNDKMENTKKTGTKYSILE